MFSSTLLFLYSYTSIPYSDLSGTFPCSEEAGAVMSRSRGVGKSGGRGEVEGGDEKPRTEGRLECFRVDTVMRRS